ncbi:hypothetical protein JHD50_03380 [Sulfurimonas sp. MAG313]|nr:hypothetical protein [Sulfurimonas sp. MAG313]MDF1880354.1 hypothetical protein [Sulfurimonas sp. MAG313]
MPALFLVLIMLSTSSMAKEIFSKEHIAQYLNLDNPFVYSAVGEKFVYQERENKELGNFDTKIVLDYDKKRLSFK